MQNVQAVQKNQTKFEILRMSPTNTNSVLVSRGYDGVIFDAWGRADAWTRELNAQGITLRAIYATHGHGDHISAAPALCAKYGVPWYMGVGDANLIPWGNAILEYFELPPIAPDAPRATDLKTGTTTILGDVKMNIIPAPGHSPGGVMYHFPDNRVLISGDTIFRDGVGRCDLPGGDDAALRETIHNLATMNLPDDTYVVHGHGNDSTIGILRTTNTWFI